MTKINTKNMSLTVDDQKWIKLLFDRQDEVYTDIFAKALDIRDKELTKALAEVVSNQDERMFKALNDQNLLICEIKTSIDRIMCRLNTIEDNLDSKEIRLRILERYVNLKNTIVRIAIGIIIGVAMALMLGVLLHGGVERKLYIEPNSTVRGIIIDVQEETPFVPDTNRINEIIKERLK
jgi:hypothetical protein